MHDRHANVTQNICIAEYEEMVYAVLSGGKFCQVLYSNTRGIIGSCQTIGEVRLEDARQRLPRVRDRIVFEKVILAAIAAVIFKE